MTAITGPAGQLLLALLGAALALTLVRLLRGPGLADRIVALDLMTTIGVAICGLYAVTTDRPVFLDVAVIMALIAFVGTVAFARYLEERQRP
jgi:multicomponent Na+:H+ antiporter subunit F